MQILRGPNGCPWDREQTHQTLKPCLIEEAYEVLEAIELDHPSALQEELGDLLLQVLVHSEIAHERQAFSLEDILKSVTQKLIRRHPHVFGDSTAKNSAEALQHWSRIKEAERSKEGKNSFLSGIPNALPALQRAQKTTERAAMVGFDWTDLQGVRKKVKEEWAELGEAIQKGERDSIEAEFGDLLLSLTSLARFLKIDGEQALRLATNRFERRFHVMEQKAVAGERILRDLSLEELNSLWEEAKREL